jgi:hypothetical protein
MPLSACVSLESVESTPEGIFDAVAPGDRVRLTTRDRGPLVMQVRTVTDLGLQGRIEGGPKDVRDELDQVRFDRIETIDIERLSVKRTMLRTFVPAVIAAVILCNNTDCATRSGVTTTF